MNSLETLLAAMKVVGRTDPADKKAHDISLAVFALLTEAFDYTIDWKKGRLKDRGHNPAVIYRKELILAEAIVRGQKAA